MRVLILANLDVGLYKFRKELIEELLQRGNEVFISLPDGELVKILEKIGCVFVETPIDRRGVNPITDLRLLNRYKKMMISVNPDLVITYTIKPNIYGGIAAILAKKQYAENITGLGTAFETTGLIKTIVVSLYKYALKNAKVIFFENNSNRDELVSLRCCSLDKTIVLNGAGVNTETYCYLPYPNNDIFKFLFIGRVMKEKGIDELFEAMKRLVAGGYNCFLDVVGPFEDNYSIKLTKFEEEGWMKYHGFQEDVIPYIKNCDCFVLPSYHEGMANTNLECASSGRPIITSNIPGCKEAVVDGKTGFLCDPQNADSLYLVMKKMLEIPKYERVEMGRQGRIQMIRRFERESVVETTLEKLLA